MTPERWQQIRDVLEEAQELEPSQRSAFLDRACLSDQSLRQEVEVLLASGDDARATFLQSAGEPDGLIANLEGIFSGGGLQAGQLFAERFQLIRKLGEGGMGQVWLAEQTSPVRRQVALKLIKAGMYDEAVVQRFQSERQSLAIMDHPAIAKVFDAGATPQGQPYFVMEYVPGLPITEYCDQKKLKIRGAARTFHPSLRRRAARAPESHHSSRSEAGEHSGRGSGRQTGAADHRLRVGQGDHAAESRAKASLRNWDSLWERPGT